MNLILYIIYLLILLFDIIISIFLFKCKEKIIKE